MSNKKTDLSKEFGITLANQKHFDKVFGIVVDGFIDQAKALLDLFRWIQIDIDKTEDRVKYTKRRIEERFKITSTMANDVFRRWKSDAYGLLHPDTAALPKPVKNVMSGFSEENKQWIYNNNTVKVINPGTLRSRTVAFESLDANEIRQSFTAGGARRSKEEQIKWIEARQKKPEGYLKGNTYLMYYGYKSFEDLESGIKSIMLNCNQEDLDRFNEKLVALVAAFEDHKGKE